MQVGAAVSRRAVLVRSREMGSKVAIASGLLAGIVAGGALVGAIVVYAPIPTPAPVVTASPSPSAGAGASPARPSASAVVSPSVVPSASGSPAASGSPSASGSASASPASSPSSSASTDLDAFGVGKPAPPLSVPRLGGGIVDLASLRGKPVWVNFMATWCPPCRDQLPVMNGFAARYASSGLVVLVIDVREDQDAVAAFMTSLKVNLPVGIDTNGTAQGAWRATALPVHFWIGKDGVVRAGALGGIGPDVMATSLQTILPGVTVTP